MPFTRYVLLAFSGCLREQNKDYITTCLCVMWARLLSTRKAIQLSVGEVALPDDYRLVQ